MSTCQIRPMTEDEVGLAIEWAALEGWNPGLNDAACFYAADPEGFLVGLLDGEPIAAISAVRYGETFGFLGLYIVKPQYRGRGYGLQIWKAAMDRMQGRNIGLDGVVEQQENYRKSGFRRAHRNARYEGTGGRPFGRDGDVVELSAVPFSEVGDYDRLFFPDVRTRFLKAWTGQSEGASLGVRADGKLAGYGVIRPCRAGYKIGPLFADTPALAQTLFSALTARVPAGAPVCLDVPETNPQAAALARRHQMKVVFETVRMYTGAFPELPMDKLFGITTFELG
ncbi:MAG: GNAT family N-acetyltransferase [Gammaproteobacteria bacterium]|nr:GNAT family N-acetyltransferase [Gammaproteobacteria bacterium]